MILIATLGMHFHFFFFITHMGLGETAIWLQTGFAHLWGSGDSVEGSGGR